MFKTLSPKKLHLFYVVILLLIVSFASVQAQQSGPVLQPVDSSRSAGTRNMMPIPMPRFNPGNTVATVTHTDYGGDNTLTGGDVGSNTSIACMDAETGNHAETSYYRRFNLSTLTSREGTAMATKDYTVTRVLIGVQDSNGSFPVSVRIYTLPSQTDFRTEYLILLAETSLPSISNQTQSIVAVDIMAKVPAGYDMVVEVYTPSVLDVTIHPPGTHFYIGSNTAAKTSTADLSYIRAPGCGISQPRDIATINMSAAATMRMVMAVEGFVDLHQALANPSFEDDADGDKQPDKWTHKDLTTGDRRLCNNQTRVYHGTCSWRINGAATQRQLIQKVTNIDDTQSGSVLVLGSMFASDNSGNQLLLKAKVTYTSGEPDTITVKAGGNNADLTVIGANQYQSLLTTITLDSRQVLAVKVFINVKSTSGTDYIDFTTLSVIK